jgi:hypothetical protein
MLHIDKKTLQSGTSILFLTLAIAAAKSIFEADQAVYQTNEAPIYTSAVTTDSFIVPNMMGIGEDGVQVVWLGRIAPGEFDPER